MRIPDVYCWVDLKHQEKEDQPKEFTHGMASEKPKALSQLAMQRKARAEAHWKVFLGVFFFCALNCS